MNKSEHRKLIKKKEIVDKVNNIRRKSSKYGTKKYFGGVIRSKCVTKRQYRRTGPGNKFDRSKNIPLITLHTFHFVCRLNDFHGLNVHSSNTKREGKAIDGSK